MLSIKCPILDCQYRTEEGQIELAVVLLQLHSKEHDTTTASIAKSEKVRRPTISLGGTPEEWAYFTSRWSDYKAATKLNGPDATMQLLECCDETFMKDLTRTNGGSLRGKSETDVLEAIHSLTVRIENIMVSRVELMNSRQDRHEPIRTIAARLQGQAGVCDFLVECSNCTEKVSYKDQMICDTLVRGLADSDIQLEIISKQNQDMTLEEAIRFIEAKESGKPHPGQFVYPTLKQYSLSHQRLQETRETCSGWLLLLWQKTFHGKFRREREQTCPAFNNTCKKCNIKGHFDSVCRRGKPKETLQCNINDTFDNALYSIDCNADNVTLCTINCHEENKSPDPYSNGCHIDHHSIVEEKNDVENGNHNDTITNSSFVDVIGTRVLNLEHLEHHIYNDMCNTWEKRPSDPQPTVEVNITSHGDDYKTLDLIPPYKHPKTTTSTAMADTGANLAGMTVGKRTRNSNIFFGIFFLLFLVSPDEAISVFYTRSLVPKIPNSLFIDTGCSKEIFPI